MSTEAQDLEFIRLAAPDLQDFLLSDEIFWPMGRQRLSMGLLLLVSARLRALPPTAELEQSEAQIQAARDRWRTHWERKAAREMPMRLRLWTEFMNDYAHDPVQGAREYPTGVRWRVILQLLSAEAGGPSAGVVDTLAGLDRRLRAAFVPGAFVWDAAFERSFPASDYWYLYGSLRT